MESFLLFCCATTAIKDENITIQIIPKINEYYYPQAQTCNKTLILYDNICYKIRSKKEQMDQFTKALNYSIQNSPSFGIV